LFLSCEDEEIGLVNLNSASYKNVAIVIQRIIGKDILADKHGIVRNTVNTIATKKNDEIPYQPQRGAFTKDEIAELLGGKILEPSQRSKPQGSFPQDNWYRGSSRRRTK